LIGWGSIAYGAALSGLAAAGLLALALRERRAAVLFVGAASAVLGPVAWNAILHGVDARGFFVDAPVTIVPVSWQDTGSGVFTLAAAALLLGIGPLAHLPGRRLAITAALCGLAAFLVDVYLY